MNMGRRKFLMASAAIIAAPTLPAPAFAAGEIATGKLVTVGETVNPAWVFLDAHYTPSSVIRSILDEALGEGALLDFAPDLDERAPMPTTNQR